MVGVWWVTELCSLSSAVPSALTQGGRCGGFGAVLLVVQGRNANKPSLDQLLLSLDPGPTHNLTTTPRLPFFAQATYVSRHGVTLATPLTGEGDPHVTFTIGRWTGKGLSFGAIITSFLFLPRVL